jgi:hypothetical protein
MAARKKKSKPSSYQPAARDTTSIQLPPELTQLIEELARNNHDNWAAARIKDGWTLGARRDDRAKTHPCLVPYAELPEGEKDLDRRAAVETIKSIMQLEFRIVPPGVDAHRAETEATSSENGAQAEPTPLLTQLVHRLANDRSLTTQEIAHAWRAHDPEEWRTHPEIYRRAGYYLIQRGDNILAQEILSEARRLRTGDDAVMDYLLALALARSGALERAGDVARAVNVVGVSDLDLLEDMLSLPGRIYKDLARSARTEQQRKQYLQGAFEAYSAAFRQTKGGFPAINAATMALLLGRDAKAKTLARTANAAAEKELELQQDAAKRGWSLATQGEAALIQGDLSKAEQHYRDAVALMQDNYGSIASMRRQARLIMQHSGADPAWLESILHIGSVVVFSGHMVDRPNRAKGKRFPSSMAEQVKQQIRERLDKLDARFGFSAAAAGGDILFLEAMQERGAQTVVVLPYDRDQFIKSSVDLDPDADWITRFEQVLQRAKTAIIVSSATAPSSAVLEYGDLLTLGLAVMESRSLDTNLVGVAVWDGKPSLEGTAGAVRLWREAGHPVEVVSLTRARGRRA